MKKNAARILIAGTNSGCGKTTVTCALLSALKQRNLKVSSFKCGPDYIDPMFHGKAIGVSSSNLDLFFYDENTLKNLLAENSEEISVIEGVMGFYDGTSFSETKASSYHLAKTTETPVILTINCKGLAYSVLPIIEGFANHKKDYKLSGVILNNTTKSSYIMLKKTIEEYFAGEIKVFGYLPKLPEDLIIESRHLGLVTANEIENIKEKLQKLGELASEYIDIEKIIETANSANEICYEKIDIQKICDVNIAVALDNAFCFYYKDSLKLLEKLGANIKYFSPLKDTKLPKNIDGIYLGGGYPELYLKELSENETMKDSIKNFLEQNKPCIAECGGFMYLTQSIDNHKMIGFLSGECKNTKKLSRFGYATLTAKSDNILCEKSEKFKAHEFHYYDCTENGDTYTATKESGKNWDAVHSNQNLYAGYPHISFYSNIKIAENFVRACDRMRGKKSEKY